MKTILQEYVPFEHENINYINNLIAFAREQKKKGTSESALATTVIYTNLVEYIAGHLLRNIKHMVHLVTYFLMKGVVFPRSYDKAIKNKTLGQLKDELKFYEFPDKEQFIELLGKFNGSRNRLLHSLMNAKTQEEISKLDVEIVRVQDMAEEILQKYNVLIQGIQSVWKDITTTQASPPQQETK